MRKSVTLVRMSAVMLLALGLGTTLAGRGAQARAPGSEQFAPAMSASGNFLAALVAGANRDVNAEAQFLRQALKNTPRDPDLLERALIAFSSNGDMVDAFQVATRLTQAEKATDRLSLAHMLLGVRAMRDRRFAQARRAFERAAIADQPDAMLGVLKAWALFGEGNRRAALTEIANFKQADTRVLMDFVGGLIADAGNDRKTALELLKRAHEAEPREIRIADAYARLLARIDRKQEALAVYKSVDDALPGQVLIARPYRSVREGKVPDQIIGSALEGAAELFFILSDTGDNSPGSRIRNQIYLQIATYLAPNGDVYGMALGQSFEATGQIQRAIDIYNTIEAGSEFQHTAEIRKAQGLARLERTDEAIAVIKALIASEPQNLESIQSLADLYRTEKRWAEAIAAYDIAATMAKGNNAESWQILFSRGVSHERNKNWAAAEADLKQSLAMMPAARPGTRGAAQRAQVMNYLAYSWVDRDENIPQAFDMLKEAVELTAGRDGYIVDSLGWAYYRRGMYEQAVVELEKAVALKPGDPVINDHLGDAYHKVGRKLEATFKWNHALALKPDDDVKKRLQEKIAGGPVDVPKVNAAGDSKNGG